MLGFVNILLGLLSIALMLGLIRLLRGESLPDRVVALDVLNTIGVGIGGLFAIGYGLPVFLDIAIIVALINFIGTVAFARYLERRAQP